MRLRNIAGSRERIAESKYCVNNPKEYKGRWKQLFENENPIHIEVGMGKGKFIMRMSEAHPEINYIGIEMYSSVLIRAIEQAEALEESGTVRKNFIFIRMDARELTDVFGPGEIGKVYLNFSDPWPKERHAKRRLTSVDFLKRYEQILPAEAKVEFKTDNTSLFDFSLEQVEASGWKLLSYTRDLHNDTEMNAGNIMTEYEEKFTAQGIPINKLIIQKM